MRVERLPLEQAVGHLLLHNVVDVDGRRLIRKGVALTAQHLDKLRSLDVAQIEVAILDEDDVWEDDAAGQLAAALEAPELTTARGIGGRINFQTAVQGVLYVDVARLAALNQLPGVTLATRRQHTVVKPERGENRIATLKIIPYAIPQTRLQTAIDLASARPGIMDVRPLAPRRLALLISGDPATHERLQRQFEPPTRQRLQALNSDLGAIETVPQTETALVAALQRLLPQHDGLILAGQTSIMDLNDLPLRALRAAGARVTVHGAPVDPGNLLALARLDGKTILCAPGCARSPTHNIMDLVLPRLLVGERLDQADIATMGLGGLLKPTPH